LGHFPDLSLAEAREKAKDVQASIRLGADPRAEDDAKKAVPTFSEFFEEQYMPHARPRKRTADKDEEYYRLRLKDTFGRKRLNQITRREIQLFHSKLHDEGLAPATCNHYLKLMKRTLNLAIQWEIIEGPNSACGIEQTREENMIENYLTDEELKRFVNVLHTDANRNVSNIILLLLNCGCRVGEILSLRWCDCDLKNRVIRITAKNSKSRRVRSVPLNPGALKILETQYHLTKDMEYCFVNPRTRTRYRTVSKVFDRLKRRGSVSLRLHDLRHNFASMLINDGRTLYEVQQILGHSNPKVTQRYAHLTAKTLEAAANCASDRIDQVMKKTA
jgi:integrase